jgi:hypothetical protein
MEEQGDELVELSLTRDEVLLLVDGLHSMEYWDFATEFDLPRRNGQVFLPEDDGSWGDIAQGSDEELAAEQIRHVRQLAARLEAQMRGGRSQTTSSC